MAHSHDIKHISSPAPRQRGRFFSGTSGLVLAEPNKAAYPPEFRSCSRLEYYARLHNSLEVNSSFYKVPQGKTFEKWAAEVPDGFQLTIKLWQGITHAPGMKYPIGSIDSFMEAANRLGDRKGPLLVQLPPSATNDRWQELHQLLTDIRANDSPTPWRLAVEFRHPSWYQPETYRMLEQFAAATVLQDMPKSTIADAPKTAGFIYLRFHGPAGDYKGGYSDNVLLGHARTIQTWQASGLDVYVYFNNTIGDALANLTTLDRFVKNS